MGCRKNAKSLTAAERTAFTDAFTELLDNGTAQEYADIHAGAGLHGHGGPAFTAWHREFVRRFELDLQAVDSSVSIPYWDWTESNTNSSGTASLIWRDDFLGGPGDTGAGSVGSAGGFPVTSGPFAGRLTRKPFNIFSFPGTGGSISASLANPDYDIFTNIEGPHGSAHVFCGGDVQSFATTCRTPDFWLIHCNVDRLWAQWMKNHEGTAGFEPYKPVAGGPTGHSLHDTMWPWNGTSMPFGIAPWINSPVSVTPADMIDHLALGYRYDTVDGCGGFKHFKENLGKEIEKFREGPFKAILPKELKERGPKEFKELGPKEFKEGGPKEFKELGPKEFKEGGPKEFVEGDRKSFQEGGVFIDPTLRPDLSAADLTFEPGVSSSDLTGLRGDLLSRRANLLRQR